LDPEKTNDVTQEIPWGEDGIDDWHGPSIPDGLQDLKDQA